MRRLQFVNAVMGRWPHAVLQFEDFNLAHAQPLLERYRKHHLIFNDDIQAYFCGPSILRHLPKCGVSCAWLLWGSQVGCSRAWTQC